jgi:hypothetical protein
MISNGSQSFMLSIAAVAISAGVGAAEHTSLAPARGGLWEVSRSAKGMPDQRRCVADPITLGQWEHRESHCSRVILADEGDRTLINYSCSDGGFGRSEITVLTPRTLRIATQGIAGGAPFNYILHARRVGNCTTR